MAFTEKARQLLNSTFTLNGDMAYRSTESPCLDYFALVGGYRHRLLDCQYYFYGAFLEDRLTAIKLLFYTRDIREGLGERKTFRYLLNALASSQPEIVKKLVPYIPSYGRYDDLWALLCTPVEETVIELVTNQLKEDVASKKENKPISLLAKWMPSINTSSSETRKMAMHIADKLGLTKQEYRKTLSMLRQGMIVENNLREKDYSFDYGSVPSVAMHKYHLAFNRNDKERYNLYIKEVIEGKQKINTEVMDVVLFINRLQNVLNLNVTEIDWSSLNDARKPQFDLSAISKEDSNYYNATWKSLCEESTISKKTLVVRDGSGSMYTYDSRSPIDVANAMSILTASRLTGAFKDKFITFSSNPEFVDLSPFSKIEEKLAYLSNFDDCANTDIEKVYNLIYDVYNAPDFKEEDTIDQIMIISDMQFDKGVDNYQSTYESFKKKFEDKGWKLPEIVFWNCCAYGNVPVTQREKGVKLISGSSKNIIDLVTKNDALDPKDFMNKALEKYAFIDSLLESDE